MSITGVMLRTISSLKNQAMHLSNHCDTHTGLASRGSPVMSASPMPSILSCPSPRPGGLPPAWIGQGATVVDISPPPKFRSSKRLTEKRKLP